jgi:hypothetical protein
LAKFVVTIKLGSNGASAVWRDVETGEVGSSVFAGPPQLIQRFIKRTIEASPDVEVKYE